MPSLEDRHFRLPEAAMEAHFKVAVEFHLPEEAQTPSMVCLDGIIYCGGRPIANI